MADPEDFLARWSRRKREAKVETENHPKQDENAASRDAKSDALTPPSPAPTPAADAHRSDAEPAPIFDISKLPSLDSIGPATDISVFMQPGVPEVLSRAALRRAWSADPAIRDFIGLSENSWDFTASDGMHGFGALDPADAKRLLAQLFGGDDDEREVAANRIAGRDAQIGPDEAKADESGAASDDSAAIGLDADASEGHSPTERPLIPSAQDRVASQQNAAAQDQSATVQRRGRGRALPQ